MTPNTIAQREAALGRANEVRTRKKVAKEQLRAGKITLPEALRSPTREIRDLGVRELLLATPHLGEKKIRRILMRASMSPTLRVGNLNRLQQDRLLREYRTACPAVWSRLHGH